MNEAFGREYRRLTLSETVEILTEKKDTLILCHTRPDCDTIGSAFALKQLLEMQGMKSHCLCSNELPKRLQFLSFVQESLLSENMPDDFSPERIIAVDTASPAQLGSLADEYIGRIDLMIDHHGKGEQYADGYIVPDISATGELVFDISREMLCRGAIDSIDGSIDACIYAAISSDTGCFKYSSVSPKTHIVAAELLRGGIDAAEINRRLFDSKPFIQMRAEQIGAENLKLYCGGKIAIIEFPYELKKANGIEDEYMETLIDVARGIEGVEVAAAIRQPTEKGVFRCSMRSNSDVDVSKICSSFGGGGHVKAAGCTIEAESASKAAEMILSAIGEI